jgi:two-component system chemotaxis response regulator CheY
MTSNLLLVANDHDYREVLQIRLEALGYHVQFPESSEELKNLALQPWDMIVSDLVFNGYDTEKLLALLKPQSNPVFFYTEKNAQEVAPLWKGKGVKEVFPKLRRGELIKAVQLFMDSNKMDSDKKAEALPSPSRGLKFLLVDDSPTIRKFVRKVLEGGFAGCQIFEAEDGKTAMHELSGQKMDLIVTDMQMPGVDGQSFIKTLHRNTLLSKKPIVIFSGMVTNEMHEEFGTVPTVRILSKPADPVMIVDTVNSLLKN